MVAGRAVLCHWSTHTQRARAAARRSICCTARTLSTSPWKRGTLARSPACGCAAAHARPLGPLPPEPTTRRARAVAPRRLCSPARALSISPWKRGTLARSPACWCAAARAGSRRGVAFRHRNMQTFTSMLIQRVRAVARRRVCFTTRSLSISPWLRGTLARSPPCECAAARVGSRRGWGGGSLPLEH